MKFTLEQLNKYSNYSQICEKFLNLAKDDMTREKLEKILYEGQTEGYSIKSKFECRDNSDIERRRRISMASLLIRNPDTFAFFEENNINIFHGTKGNSLPSIIKYGICSHKLLESKDVAIQTGEALRIVRPNYEFISFTDALDTALEYSSLSSANPNELSFGIVIGISEDALKNAKIVTVSSDKSEIGVLDSLPLEAISCVCVPEDKFAFVRKLLCNTGITVLGMQDIETMGYYIDELEIIYLSTNKYQKPISKKQRFSFEDLKELAKSRTLLKMQEMAEYVKNVFTKGKEDEVRRNSK